jgi:hypothetical protein
MDILIVETLLLLKVLKNILSSSTLLKIDPLLPLFYTSFCNIIYALDHRNFATSHAEILYNICFVRLHIQ